MGGRGPRRGLRETDGRPSTRVDCVRDPVLPRYPGGDRTDTQPSYGWPFIHTVLDFRGLSSGPSPALSRSRCGRSTGSSRVDGGGVSMDVTHQSHPTGVWEKGWVGNPDPWSTRVSG